MRNKPINIVRIQLEARSVNESFSRASLAAFISPLDPDFGELADLRTAMSEAVTNAVTHAYKNRGGIIYITVSYTENRTVKIVVRDKGCGIENIEQAMLPLYTSDTTGERGGMGFTIMKSFTDHLRVSSRPGKGTSVTMIKKLSAADKTENK